MPTFVLVAIAVVLVGLGFFMSGCARGSAGGDGKSAVTRQGMSSLTREQLAEKLRKLETRAAPEPKMGAMCYDMAAPPSRVDYVCPTCGEKTLYTNQLAWAVDRDVLDCRREFALLKKSSELSVKLDESSFCSHCSPQVKEPKIALIVTFADGTSHTNRDVSPYDVIILREFLKGGLSFKTFNDGTEPLKQHAPRLRELLGLSPEAKNGGG